MNCEQKVSGGGTCPTSAVAIWTWVTGERVAVCPDHKRAASVIAAAMGYGAIFEPVRADATADLCATLEQVGAVLMLVTIPDPEEREAVSGARRLISAALAKARGESS